MITMVLTVIIIRESLMGEMAFPLLLTFYRIYFAVLHNRIENHQMQNAHTYRGFGRHHLIYGSTIFTAQMLYMPLNHIEKYMVSFLLVIEFSHSKH